MRGRRHSAGRRPKRAVRWFVNPLTFGGSTATLLTHLSNTTVMILSTADVSAAGQLASIPYNQPRLRFEGLRGRLTFNNSSTTNQHIVNYGLMVIDLVGNAVGSVPDPTVGLDLSKSWLHYDHCWLDARVASGNSSMSTQTRELTIKTKRLLRPEQALVLILQDVPLSGVANEVYYTSHFRNVISHVD